MRLRRDLYATVPPDVSPESFQADRFQVLAAWIPDAIFCGHSALELHGVAYSLWNECSAYTAQGRHTFNIQETRYRLLRNPKELLSTAQSDLGVRTYDRGGVFVKGLGPERTLVEGFRSSGPFGGLAEFVTSARGYQLLNWDLLETILTAFGKKKLYAAVGWFLETQMEHLDVPLSLLKDLRSNIPRAPVYLERTMGAGEKVFGWNLLLPERLTRMEESDAPES